MNRISIVTADGYLALFEFNFPNLTQIVATQLSTSALYNVTFHNNKFAVSDKKTVQIFTETKQQYEYPVDVATNLASFKDFLLIATPLNTFIYDSQNTFTTTDPSTLIRIRQNAPILADNKHLMVYKVPDRIISKINYMKHLNEYLVDFDIIEDEILLIGQRKVIKFNASTDTITYQLSLENDKITSFCHFKNFIYLGMEDGKVIQLDQKLIVQRKCQVSDSRIKQLKEFGDFIVFATTAGKLGILTVDEDQSLMRVTEVNTNRRINEIDVLGGYFIGEEQAGLEEE